MSQRGLWVRRIAAVLIPLSAQPAEATRRLRDPARFDGTWSIEIVTEAGACDRAYRYPVRIEGGQARFVGMALVIRGGVAGDGAVRGSVSNGAASADVVGRLGADGLGRGTWIATGLIECRGHWNARRQRAGRP